MNKSLFHYVSHKILFQTLCWHAVCANWRRRNMTSVNLPYRFHKNDRPVWVVKCLNLCAFVYMCECVLLSACRPNVTLTSTVKCHSFGSSIFVTDRQWFFLYYGDCICQAAIPRKCFRCLTVQPWHVDFKYTDQLFSRPLTFLALRSLINSFCRPWVELVEVLQNGRMVLLVTEFYFNSTAHCFISECLACAFHVSLDRCLSFELKSFVDASEIFRCRDVFRALSQLSRWSDIIWVPCWGDIAHVGQTVSNRPGSGEVL